MELLELLLMCGFRGRDVGREASCLFCPPTLGSSPLQPLLLLFKHAKDNCRVNQIDK